MLNQVQKQEIEQYQKCMEKKVFEFKTFNESLIKERQQSILKIARLEKKSNQLDANLRQRELTQLETKQKMEETTERLRGTEEKNLELHNLIFVIDCQGEKLQSVISIERKTMAKQGKLLLRADTEFRNSNQNLV